VIRAAWGFYYAQTPPIFMTDSFNQSSLTTQFCCSFPASGFPYLFPGIRQGSTNPCNPSVCGTINYTDPAFRNPRVSNLTGGVEHTVFGGWNLSATYVYTHSDHLKTGGFSTSQWSRNFACSPGASIGSTTPCATDAFGRAILSSANGAGGFLDGTISGAQELASFSRGNFNEFVAAVNKRFSHHFQMFGSYTWSTNSDNASSERDTETFFGAQDPFNVNLDYGRSGLDVTHQFKAGGVVDLPWGFTWSATFVAHSGFAYPAYILTDINGDGTSNQGVASNDRPVVSTGGKSFLLPRYPARQPNFFQFDTRINKDFKITERYHAQLIADLFNLTNRGNLYSNPDNFAFINLTGCAPNAPPILGNTCSPLTAIPSRGSTAFPNYGNVNQIANGSTPFAAQLGVRVSW
jgi:hypothetical protein